MEEYKTLIGCKTQYYKDTSSIDQLIYGFRAIPIKFQQFNQNADFNAKA